MQKGIHLKSTVLRLAVTSLALMSSAATSSEVEDLINSGAAKYNRGELFAAVSELKNALNLIQTKKSEIIIEALPAALEGWETEGEQVDLNDIIMEGMTVEKNYFNDKSSIDIEVVAGSSMVATMLPMITNIEMLNLYGGKVVDIKGYTGSFTNDDGQIEVKIIVSDTSLVKVSGYSEDEAVILNYANNINFEGLK